MNRTKSAMTWQEVVSPRWNDMLQPMSISALSCDYRRYQRPRQIDSRWLPFFTFNTNHDSISFRFRDTNDVFQPQRHFGYFWRSYNHCDWWVRLLRWQSRQWIINGDPWPMATDPFKYWPMTHHTWHMTHMFSR